MIVQPISLEKMRPPDDQPWELRFHRGMLHLAAPPTFNPERDLKLDRLCGKGEGKTCYVECWNYTLRQRLGRFVRKALSFSKCERMRETALRLFVDHYNLSLDP